MIHIYYCNIDRRILYACDQKPKSVTCDKHPDDNCEAAVFDIDEPNFTGKTIEMSDSTEINDSDSYMIYLERYIP